MKGAAASPASYALMSVVNSFWWEQAVLVVATRELRAGKGLLWMRLDDPSVWVIVIHCHVMLWYVMLCYVVLYYVLIWYITSCYAASYDVMLCGTVICHTKMWSEVAWHDVILCDVLMWRYVTPCHTYTVSHCRNYLSSSSVHNH